MDHQLTKTELRSRKTSRAEFAQVPRKPIRLILDSLKVAANIGTILRLADAVTAEHVYLCGNTICPPNYKIRVASTGAERWVSWNYNENIVDAIKDARSNGYKIYSIEYTKESILYSSVNFKAEKCAFVLGREFDGVHPDVIQMSDASLHLPMHGMCNSINVSSAAGVICYEYLRQNGFE